MAFSIKSSEADRLARELATLTGESLTETVLKSLQQRLEREQGRLASPRLRDELREIRLRCSKLPVLDPRSADEIIGYDESGLPR